MLEIVHKQLNIMKLGIDCRIISSRFTGIGRYTHELVTRLIAHNEKKDNPDQIVLFFNDPEYYEFTTNSPHVKKILVNARHYSLAEQTKFLRALNKEKCDLVHFPHFNIPILYKRPFIVTIHDLTLSLFPGRKMTRLHHRIAYHKTIKNAVKKAKKIIAVSKHTKKDIIEHLKVSPEKITVIYHGIGQEFAPTNNTQALEKYAIPGPYLLYTGVWRNHKNLKRLIQALGILKKTTPLKLVITGNPDPHYPEVQETVKQLGLQDDVIFPGFVSEDELVQLYANAKIYVFPSLYEGFGFPPLEAMKCGTPVVASNASSIPEICGPQNAVFFDPQDPQDIAEKIIKVYNNSELQQQLITNGLSHSAQFSWEEMVAQTTKLYV